VVRPASLPASLSTVKVVLNEEAVTVKVNPADKNHKIIALFHY